MGPWEWVFGPVGVYILRVCIYSGGYMGGATGPNWSFSNVFLDQLAYIKRGVYIRKGIYNNKRFFVLTIYL